MKFCFVGPSYPLRGGIAQYLGIFGRKLIERGHQVKVLSFRKQFPKFLFPGQTQIESSQDVIRLDSLPLFIPWNPLTWFRTFLQLRREKPDAVIFKFWMPFFAPGFATICGLTKRFTAIRIVYILDNVIPHEHRPGDRFLTRLAFRWVDRFIAQSDTVKKDLFKWFPEAEDREVYLVPHPVYDCYTSSGMDSDEARRRLNVPVDSHVLLFFGLVREYKGLDTLLKAMPEIITSLGSKTHLVVAGEFYDAEEKYQQMISDLAIGDNVRIFNQYIPNEEVEIYFRAADVAVLPYKSATQSGVIQVATHYRLPVISTAVGGLPEVIQEGRNGLLVEPENEEALAEAVTTFFESGVRSDIEHHLQAQSEDDSWGKLIEAVVV